MGLALIGSPAREPGLETEPLVDEPRVVALPTARLGRRQRDRRLADFVHTASRLTGPLAEIA